MDDETGLSDHAKEMRRWNKPYVYQEFPKMLFRGVTTTAGRVEIEQRLVGTREDEALAIGAGWHTHPTRAKERELGAQADLGTAAAERAWDDRRLSEAARAEAAAIEQATLKHLPEIPERPRRPRPARKRDTGA
jgi:hypothetical protein